MGAYKNARFIIGCLKTDFYIIMREKLEKKGYKILEERPKKKPSYTTDAPEHVRMTLHNEALDEMMRKYEGKFKDHPRVDKGLMKAITRSYYSEETIKKAEQVA